MKPKKRFAQHFLKSKELAEKIVLSISPEPNHNILEIGPGKGVLTDFIIKNFPKNKIILVELENEAYKLTTAKYEVYNVEILNQSILKYTFQDETQHSIIGNLPYNISSQILLWTLKNHKNIREAVYMFQKEVANRIVAKPNTKEYSSLSVLLQTFYKPKIIFNVSPGAFSPPPKVKSAVVKLQRKTGIPNIELNKFEKIVRRAFAKRRKILKNNIPEIPEEYKEKRAEQLSLEDYLKLYNQLVKG